MSEEPADAARLKAIHNERTKLTATYLNTAGGGLFAAGVVAPIAAAVFGVAGPGGTVPTLTLGLGALIFLCASLALHTAARYVLKGLQP